MPVVQTDFQLDPGAVEVCSDPLRAQTAFQMDPFGFSLSPRYDCIYQDTISCVYRNNTE